MKSESEEATEMGAHTIGPPNVSGTNSWKSGACQSIAGSLLCRFGVLAAGEISVRTGRHNNHSTLTGTLRLGSENSSICSLGRDCGVASGRGHGSIWCWSEGCERRRVHVEALLRVLVLVELGMVVDVGTG
jgi:hypothetical protein